MPSSFSDQISMRTISILIFILLFLLTGNSYSQTYSDITFDTGTSIDIQTGADVCATTININGTFSGGGSICTGALPVELLYFTFSSLKNNITLKWSTAFEINNSGFEVERAAVIKNIISEWMKIGSVEGSGTTNDPKLYSFEDKKIVTGSYRYRLKQSDYNGSFEYYELTQEVKVEPPKDLSLEQNYPNPSNPNSRIDYQIPVSGNVNLVVYDVLGREIIKLVNNEIKEAGYYSAVFDGSNIASGVYFYRLETKGYSIIKKIIVVK